MQLSKVSFTLFVFTPGNICENNHIHESLLFCLTDEKEGLAVSFRESSRLIEEAKKGEAQMQNKLKALEQQVKILKEKDQEVNVSTMHAVVSLLHLYCLLLSLFANLM